MPEATTTVEPTAQAAPEEPVRKRRRFLTGSDGAYWFVLYGVAFLFIAVCAYLIWGLIVQSIPAWKHSGGDLIWGKTWNTSTSQYGGLPLILGTLETSAIALLLAVPIGIAVAVSIVHLIPQRMRTPMSSLVELLAAVPSVVYGFIGVKILTGWNQATFFPWLKSVTNGFFLFSGTTSGYSVLTAGMVLFVMILPTIVALSRDAIATVPHDQNEAALSVGATKWQSIRKVIVPGARGGITGAVTLACARALGETIAVAMVIGGSYQISKSLTQGGTTIASSIATQWDGASALTIASLLALALILIVITAAVNYAGRRMLARANRGAIL